MITASLKDPSNAPSSNLWILASYAPELAKLGYRAEKYFADDPNTCLLKVRQFAELLAQTVAANVGLYTDSTEKQMDLLRKLESAGHLSREVSNYFHSVRRVGNDANHKLHGSSGDALTGLKIVWGLAVWYHRAFKDPTCFQHRWSGRIVAKRQCSLDSEAKVLSNWLLKTINYILQSLSK